MRNAPEAKNNSYTLTVSSPLVRPGLTISTTTSERYAPDAAARLMEIVRAINEPEAV